MIAPEKLLDAAKALEPQLQEWRRTLHRHPEVGFDLPQTKALVKKALTEMGYAPQDCGKCGVLALAGGKKPGRGAYVCRQESCLMRAIRQKQLERQLEVQLTDDVAEALRQELAQLSQSQTEAEEN